MKMCQTRRATRGGGKGKVMSEGVREHDCDISQGNLETMGEGGKQNNARGGGRKNINSKIVRT